MVVLTRKRKDINISGITIFFNLCTAKIITISIQQNILIIAISDGRLHDLYKYRYFLPSHNPDGYHYTWNGYRLINLTKLNSKGGHAIFFLPKIAIQKIFGLIPLSQIRILDVAVLKLQISNCFD
jgi:hypothetical protein